MRSNKSGKRYQEIFFLMHLTRGQRDESFVNHTKEDRKYYQYHKSQINIKSINLKCIYAESKNCKAKVTILPLKKDLIINGAKPKK